MRIGGKTYGSFRWALNDYRKHGHQFVYIRRYDTEFNNKGKWQILKAFDALHENEHIHPDWTTKIGKNGKFYMYKKRDVERKDFELEENVCGYYMALSTQRNERSISLPKVNKIIFDEFCIDHESGKNGYLKGEVFQFMELMSSILRDRHGCRVLMIANSISVVNPYFSYFKIKPNRKQKITNFNIKGATHTIMRHVHENRINEIKATPQGKLWASTAYGNYAINNEFLRDTEDFIQVRTPNTKSLFTILHEGVEVGFWVTPEADKLFASFTFDETKPVYTLSKSDHNTNTLLIKNIKKTHYLPMLITAFEIALLYFENQEVKKKVYDILELLSLK